MKTFLTALLLMLCTATTFAKDNNQTKTVIFTTTPQMHCEACEKKIKGNLRFEKGIKKIETNVEQQKVTVTYNAQKTTPEKLLKAFEKFGYKARIVKKDEKVKANTNEVCPNM